MSIRLSGLVLLSSLAIASAGQLPLTVKEISLMLRAGYSSNTVMQELAKRRFAEGFDPEKESLLRKSGASLELIDALERGRYSISGAEAAQAQQKIAAMADHSAAEAERSRKSDALYRAQVTRERAGNNQTAGTNVVDAAVKGDLVRFSNGGLTHAEESLANKKLIAIYFSAHWCPPCRKFTPQLVEYYNRVAPQHPEFEVVFFSFDRSPEAMQDYMRETNMPWPAIDYQTLPTKNMIKRYAGSGIPCLVLVDSTGKIISDSFSGSKYLGPGKVLTDLDAIFAKGGGDHLATNR